VWFGLLQHRCRKASKVADLLPHTRHSRSQLAACRVIRGCCLYMPPGALKAGECLTARQNVERPRLLMCGCSALVELVTAGCQYLRLL